MTGNVSKWKNYRNKRKIKMKIYNKIELEKLSARELRTLENKAHQYYLMIRDVRKNHKRN